MYNTNSPLFSKANIELCIRLFCLNPIEFSLIFNHTSEYYYVFLHLCVTLSIVARLTALWGQSILKTWKHKVFGPCKTIFP